MKQKPRLTLQRQIIKEELQKLHSHPTAFEVYEIVRTRLSKISLGTVYRNLEFLADHHEIMKLETAGKKKRFDGNINEHFHVRCLKCGRIDDIMDINTNHLVEDAQTATTFKLNGLSLEFIGLCPKCKNSKF